MVEAVSRSSTTHGRVVVRRVSTVSQHAHSLPGGRHRVDQDLFLPGAAMERLRRSVECGTPRPKGVVIWPRSPPSS